LHTHAKAAAHLAILEPTNPLENKNIRNISVGTTLVVYQEIIHPPTISKNKSTRSTTEIIHRKKQKQRGSGGYPQEAGPINSPEDPITLHQQVVKELNPTLPK
jgi:hypothetical protein